MAVVLLQRVLVLQGAAAVAAVNARCAAAMWLAAMPAGRRTLQASSTDDRLLQRFPAHTYLRTGAVQLLAWGRHVSHQHVHVTPV